MNCQEARDQLIKEGSARAVAGPVAEHLTRCAACADYAKRLDVVRQLLREHHASVEPDAGFSSRVVAALPGTPDILGWAAVKLLPAALAIVIVLGGWCYLDAHRPADLLERAETTGEVASIERAPTEDPLGWVLASNGEAM